MIESYSTKHSFIATLLIEFIDIEAKTPSYYSVQSQLSISTPLVALNNCASYMRIADRYLRRIDRQFLKLRPET